MQQFKNRKMHTTITSFHFPWSLAWWNSGRLWLLRTFQRRNRSQPMSPCTVINLSFSFGSECIYIYIIIVKRNQMVAPKWSSSCGIFMLRSHIIRNGLPCPFGPQCARTAAHLANQTDPDRPAIGPVWHGRGQAHGHFLRLRRPSRFSLVLLVDSWRCGTRMPQHVAWPCGGGLLRILPCSSKTQNAVLVLLGYVFTC